MKELGVVHSQWSIVQSYYFRKVMKVKQLESILIYYGPWAMVYRLIKTSPATSNSPASA